MKPRLPSLYALRAFESAARLGAFNKAADELRLTATAISHHIRGLEDELGTKLFERNTRKIALTDNGVILAHACSKSFETLEDVVEILRKTNARASVTIALGPLLASRWLSHRLNRFWETFTDVDLHILHTSLPVNPRAISADIYLAWGDGQWPDFDSVPFLDVAMVPVACESYLEKFGRPHRVEQLFDHHLIHQRSRSGWEQWMASQKLRLPIDVGGVVIEDANVVLRTAISGQGIALGWLPLIEDEIASGNLVPLFDQHPANPLGYHLIRPFDGNANLTVTDVVNWLIGESHQLPDL